MKVCEDGGSVQFELVIDDRETVMNIDFDKVMDVLSELVVHVDVDEYRHIVLIVKQCIEATALIRTIIIIVISKSILIMDSNRKHVCNYL